jgi:hypothetical protein
VLSCSPGKTAKSNSLSILKGQYNLQKNRLKRDRLVFFIHGSDIVAKHAMVERHLGSRASAHDAAKNFPSGLITRQPSRITFPGPWPLEFQLLSSYFELLSSGKNVFWKNEPKLCPSLLTIVKKRTQNEPK